MRHRMRTLLPLIYLLAVVSAQSCKIPTEETESITFGQDWNLRPTTLFSTLASRSGLFAYSHYLDDTSLYVGGGSDRDSNGRRYARVFQFDHAGTLLSSIDPVALATDAGLASAVTWTEWVWEDEEYDRLYIMGWNESLGYPAHELFCLNRADNTLIWRREMEDTANGFFGLYQFFATPEIWGDTLILCDITNRMDNTEPKTVITFIPRESADGAATMSREYPYYSTVLLNGNVKDDGYFFSTVYDAVVRLDLEKAADAGVAADDCVIYRDTLGSQPLDKWTYERNVVFTEDAYIYTRRNCVTARGLSDDSLLWTREINTGNAKGVNSIYGKKLFVPTWNGMLYCIDTDNGDVHWQRYLTVKETVFDAQMSLQNIQSRGEIIDGKWYAIMNGTENALFVLDIETGEKELCYRIVAGTAASPLNLFYRDGTLYIADQCYVTGITLAENRNWSYFKSLPGRIVRSFFRSTDILKVLDSRAEIADL